MYKQRMLLASSVCFVLVACGVPPKVFPDLICGFAKVIVQETDIPAFEKNFGTDSSAGQRACNAIAVLLGDDGTGESEPITIEEPTTRPLTLKDNSEIIVTLLPLD